MCCSVVAVVAAIDAADLELQAFWMGGVQLKRFQIEQSAAAVSKIAAVLPLLPFRCHCCRFAAAKSLSIDRPMRSIDPRSEQLTQIGAAISNDWLNSKSSVPLLMLLLLCCWSIHYCCCCYCCCCYWWSWIRNMKIMTNRSINWSIRIIPLLLLLLLSPKQKE